MGLDYATFDYLLNKFCMLYLCYSPYTVNGKVVVLRDAAVRKGRQRSLDPAGCLGLVLGYTRTQGSLFALQMAFGVTHSVLSLFLKFAMWLLFRI
jgi:hypothetical protein